MPKIELPVAVSGKRTVEEEFRVPRVRLRDCGAGVPLVVRILKRSQLLKQHNRRGTTYSDMSREDKHTIRAKVKGRIHRLDMQRHYGLRQLHTAGNRLEHALEKPNASINETRALPRQRVHSSISIALIQPQITPARDIEACDQRSTLLSRPMDILLHDIIIEHIYSRVEVDAASGVVGVDSRGINDGREAAVVHGAHGMTAGCQGDRVHFVKARAGEELERFFKAGFGGWDTCCAGASGVDASATVGDLWAVTVSHRENHRESDKVSHWEALARLVSGHRL